MRWNITLTSCLCLLVVTSVARAQAQEVPEERPRRPQRQQNQAPLTPQQLEAAWKLQATGFAHASQLTEEQAEKVTEAYLEARKNYVKAQRDMMRGEDGGGNRGGRGGRGGGGGAAGGEDGEDGGGNRGGRGGRGERGGFNPAMRELMTKHRDKLHDTLDDIIKGKPLERAMVTFGAFNSSWDRMVSVIAGFDLGDDKTLEALKPIEDYVADIAAIRASGDFQNMRQDIMGARSRLTGAMEMLLSVEQNSKFDQVVNTGFGGRRGASGGPGGRGGRGGRGGDRGGRGGD